MDKKGVKDGALRPNEEIAVMGIYVAELKWQYLIPKNSRGYDHDIDDDDADVDDHQW